MKKISVLILCILLSSVVFCACSTNSQAKYQGKWVYNKYSNDMGEVKDVLTIDGVSANYTREITFMGAKNTTTYANYEFKIQDGIAILIYIEGHGITTKKWELTVSGNELIAESEKETVCFKKQ